ncbi:MAG TPA: hypothetical protein VND21_06445 [Planctomycetota bacterium]|nr:hypothetical protein [Planctomycetota bacterium]
MRSLLSMAREAGGGGPPPDPAAEVEGDCWAVFAFDVGHEIDLARAGAGLAELPGQHPFRHRAGTSTQVVARSIRLQLATPALALGGFRSAASAHATVHALGAVSLAWRIPVASSAAEAAALAGLLHDDPSVAEEARAVAARVLQLAGDAVARPRLSPLYEDYVVFHLRKAPAERARLAGILRAEPAALSLQEEESALEAPISYAPSESCYVDWLGSVLVGMDMEDELRVLELANVTLLELRVLDAELTSAVDEAYDALARGWKGFSAFAPRARELGRVAQLQADGAVLYESVKNAHKLFGDDYLARLHGRALQRFRVADWDASIQRKLTALASVYGQLSDRASQRRSEALEWIIIILIAADLVAYLS